MIKKLIYYGHPGLRKKCEEVSEITDEIRQIAQDLIDTVMDKDGAGLASASNRLLLSNVCFSL